MRYVYSLIRFVPDPARGEFVNVGAVVGSEQSSEWQVRQIENTGRARAFDDRGTLAAVWDFIDRIGHQIDEYERSVNSLFEPSVELSEAWLQDLQVRHRNVVQLSSPTPMVAADANEALDRIFAQMILDPAHGQRAFQTKHTALAAVRDAYRKHEINPNEHLRERVILQTLHHRERVDFAVVNGRAVQLTHTWSFQVPDQEALAERIKAWGWTIKDARESGGTIRVSDDQEFAVEPSTDIEVVYVPPIEGHSAAAMQDAVSVFDSLHVAYSPIDRAEQVGSVAERLLGNQLRRPPRSLELPSE